jgi:acetyltransferase-like isoleucine patch superfamily enzyme
VKTVAEFFQHPQALVETETIGKGTRIWAFAHVLPNAQIGEDCNICDHVFIENDVQVGDRVTIKCGVQLWDGVTLEDDVFVGPNVTFTNDPFPRSRQYPQVLLRTLVRRGASIGANVHWLVLGLWSPKMSQREPSSLAIRPALSEHLQKTNGDASCLSLKRNSYSCRKFLIPEAT